MRSYLQRWSIIKNSAENISDERTIDAFNNGLRRTDFVEELGRVRPKTIGELMDLAKKIIYQDKSQDYQIQHSAATSQL
jgi:hypothetical protein